MLNIYGHFLSMPTNKVRLCVSYLELPHEYNHIDLTKGEHQAAEYLQINPAGRVPAIDDGGFLLSQSDAICKYLCALSGPCAFYPEDLQERARIDEWIDLGSQHLLQGIARVFFNTIVAPMLKQDVDKTSLATGIAMLKRDLPLVDAHLKNSQYLAGDKITLADITMIAALEPSDMCQFDMEAYTSVLRWRKDIMGREFYKRVHTHFGAEMSA